MFEITKKICFIVDETTINETTKDSYKIIIKDLDNVLFNFENFIKENIQSISNCNYIVINISDCILAKILDDLLKRYITIHNLSMWTMIIVKKPKELELSENKSDDNQKQKVIKQSKSTNVKTRKNRNKEPYYNQCHIGYNFDNLQHSLGGNKYL